MSSSPRLDVISLLEMNFIFSLTKINGEHPNENQQSVCSECALAGVSIFFFYFALGWVVSWVEKENFKFLSKLVSLKVVCVCVAVSVWGFVSDISVSGKQKRASDPMKLQLHKVVSLPLWVLETKSQSFARVVGALSCWVISPKPERLLVHPVVCVVKQKAEHPIWPLTGEFFSSFAFSPEW